MKLTMTISVAIENGPPDLEFDTFTAQIDNLPDDADLPAAAKELMASTKAIFLNGIDTAIRVAQERAAKDQANEG